ncbi:MAG: sigma-70 family RNA polymerase sigma factor [Acidimicrobiales bacterium]
MTDPAELVGPGEAFEEFYRRELGRQVRRAALILGDDTAANDVVHDAFTTLFARWGSVTEPGPYLQRMVLNGCRDQARRTRRLRRLLPRLAASASAQPSEILWDVLAGLPFNQRAAVVLRYYESLPEAEIAAVLDCPTGSVGPWITRGLATMRKALQ